MASPIAPNSPRTRRFGTKRTPSKPNAATGRVVARVRARRRYVGQPGLSLHPANDSKEHC